MNDAILLRRWDIFSHFSAAQLEHLGPYVTRRRLSVGEEVFQETDTGREAFVILDGKVRIQRATPYGHYSLADLGEGELFGETSFIDEQPRSGGAAVLENAELLVLDPERLSKGMAEDQRLTVALYWSFWKSLAQKLRRTNDKLTQFFTEASDQASMDDSSKKDPTVEFHIDLAAKKALFQEQKLSNMEINFLASLSREAKMSPGKLIFREGDVGDEMYVVLDGKVMISKFIPGAGEEALAFLERGDYFGEMALIDQQPRSADAKASQEGAVLLAIPREVLQGLLDIHKVSSLRLLTILSNLIAKRLRELNEKLITWFIFSGGSSS
ncbi:MAG: cyclic nucleotide-binding domain-containing protein [Deltaproteobacteria bacterium]|nr:cyclic nucleotide-binding domain-containing protein [Deltaproteobacteria bacterium]